MALLLSDPYLYLDSFLLVFIRILGFMLIAPFYGNGNVPNMAKIAFTFFLSVIIVSTSVIVAPVSSGDLVGYAMVAIIEFGTGVLLGFSVYMMYSILSLAGQFIDMQIGFSMVNVFDPLSQIQLTITGNLYYYMLMMVTLITNAHHYFLRNLVKSFMVIPLGGAVLSPDLYDSLIEGMSMFFSLALQVASPVFFVMLITNVILGILARAVPQLNMFVIGFPIKIMLGLLTIFIMLTAFSLISDRVIGESEMLMREVVNGLAPK